MKEIDEKSVGKFIRKTAVASYTELTPATFSKFIRSGSCLFVYAKLVENQKLVDAVKQYTDINTGSLEANEMSANFVKSEGMNENLTYFITAFDFKFAFI